MAYNSGNIISADPAAALITALVNVLDAHTGQWEFVETVTISSIDYQVWKNRGTTVTNPNAWGTDFYFAINRQSATEIRIKVFESWDATNKKMIRPCRSSSTAVAPNANGSYGDETNGYTVDTITSTNVAYSGFVGLATTGFDWFIAASKDRVYIALKQGSVDQAMGWGIFETLLTSSPAEGFPLYLLSGSGSTPAANGAFAATQEMAWSRHPGVTASQASNFRGGVPSSSLSPTMGGIDSPTLTDRFHNGSWLLARPLVTAQSGSVSTGATHGYYRGLMYDVVRLADNGATTRNGDTVTLAGDVYVLMRASSWTHWVRRDAT